VAEGWDCMSVAAIVLELGGEVLEEYIGAEEAG
jgi:hypothetical protein